MHSAKLENSDRLQRVLRALQTGPKTTREIIQIAGVCAVNSIISEIRNNNIKIHCKALRRGVYEYRLDDGRLF